MNRIKKYQSALTTALLLGLYFRFAEVSFADVLSDRIERLATSTEEISFVQNVLDLSIPISVFALIGLCGYAGFLMITSQGDPEKLGLAKEVITNAFIGFTLIALSVGILLVIQNLLNIPIP